MTPTSSLHEIQNKIDERKEKRRKKKQTLELVTGPGPPLILQSDVISMPSPFSFSLNKCDELFPAVNSLNGAGRMENGDIKKEREWRRAGRDVMTGEGERERTSRASNSDVVVLVVVFVVDNAMCQRFDTVFLFI